jgi:hypothetical protein
MIFTYSKIYLHKSILFIYIFGVSAIFISIMTKGWSETWIALQIDSVYPYFADLRSIQGAIISSELGLNPQENNPGDPWGRIMNYPQVWLEIAKIFNITNDLHFLIFGVAILMSFIICCIELLRRFPNIFLLISLFSSSTLLAVERGNNDLLIFSLVFISLFMSQKLQACIVLIAIILKIYPVFSIINHSLSKKKWIVYLLIILIIVLLYSPQFTYILEGNTASGSKSYGLQLSFEIFMVFRSQFSDKFVSKNDMYFDIIFLSVAIFMLFIVFTQRKQIYKLISIDCPEITAKSLEARMFLAGAGIYCGTFIFSTNHDYRLIFLIMCFPFLQIINKFIFKILLPMLIILVMNFSFIDLVLGKYSIWIGYFVSLFSKNLVFVFLLILLFQSIPKVRKLVI